MSAELAPVFLKLGGSLITDKTSPETSRREVLHRLAHEIVVAKQRCPALPLLIGHGSGSFGHTVAARYRVREGVAGRQGWHGFAATAKAARALNRLVVDALWDAGVDVVPLPPLASGRCHDGILQDLAWEPVARLLKADLTPLVFGDVVLDDVRGGTIVSTEELFRFLALKLRPARIILAGEVAGVFTADPHRDPDARLIRRLTAETLSAGTAQFAAVHGTDVTGGMSAKVAEMVALTATLPGLTVQIVSGLVPGRVQNALLGKDVPGTIIGDEPSLS